jgi:hypothetical protein
MTIYILIIVFVYYYNTIKKIINVFRSFSITREAFENDCAETVSARKHSTTIDPKPPPNDIKSKNKLVYRNKIRKSCFYIA